MYRIILYLAQYVNRVYTFGRWVPSGGGGRGGIRTLRAHWTDPEKQMRWFGRHAPVNTWKAMYAGGKENLA